MSIFELNLKKNQYIISESARELDVYKRQLYGGPSLFRIETSDMPIFAAYHKSENRNIHFTVTVGDKTMRLDSVADCKAYYIGGERRYELSDPAWGKGSIEMTVVATYDREGAIWKVVRCV